MGTNSYKRKKYLTIEDIDNIFSKKPSLSSLFSKLKNADGFLGMNELRIITEGLLNESLLKKIMQICGSRDDKLSYEDFLYFYALLNTNKLTAKLNFILDFIFTKKNTITKGKYIKKVKKYFENSDTLQKILFSSEILNYNITEGNNQSISFVNPNEKIERDFVYDCIVKNHYDEIFNYELYKSSDNCTNQSNNITSQSNNINITSNNNINDKQNYTYSNQKISKMKVIETQNNNNNNNLKNEIVSDNLLVVKSNTINNTSSRNDNNKNITNGDISKTQTLIRTLTRRYDVLAKEFQNFEKLNNGVFPISLFEEMLNEINVKQSLIDVIGNYLRQKTQKSFINFELFKEIMSIITIPTLSLNMIDENEEEDTNKIKQEIIDGLFTLFAYPNEFISKNSFFIFAKSTKPELSSNSIKELFNHYGISKYIDKKKFVEIIVYIINELIESFEHIKYLPYIFFKTKIEDRTLERNCIEILLKNKSLKEYIIERLQYDNVFYIIDKNFWDKWLIFTSKLKSKITSSNRNTDNNIETNVNSNVNIPSNSDINMNQNKIGSSISTVSNSLKMMTSKICDRNGKIKEGLVYDKDFIILSQRLYSLFCKWYGTPINMEIKRDKIFLDDDEDCNDLDSNKNELLSNDKKFNKNNDLKNEIKDNLSIFQSEDYNTHQKYELEIFPIFLLFFNFVDMLKKNCVSMKNVEENIKSSMELKNGVRHYPFSRKTKFGDLLKPLQESINMTLNRKIARLWVYYQEKFEIVPFDCTLEKYGIVNSAVIVLEINENNYWPSQKLEKEPLNKIKKKSLSLVGLMNIGNTCYMNSILQIFLNIQEIRDIFIRKEMSEQEEKNFYDFIINKKNRKGELITEFINILKEKWLRSKKSITPKKFKEICGKYNETFKGFEQQDAHDFYTFLVDNLHEDTNLKFLKTSITNSDSIDTNELELSNEYWANTVRNNASYIYGLFMGQLKSTLTCNVCNVSKLKYETFSSIELPIPEGGMIILEIILFRLPCTLSPFYNGEININKQIFSNNVESNNNIKKYNNNNLNDNKSEEKIKEKFKTNKQLVSDELTINIRKKLKTLKNISIGKYAEPGINSPLGSDRDIFSNDLIFNSTKIKNINKKNNHIETILNTSYYEKNKNITKSVVGCYNNKNEVISNALNFNIPVKLRLEIERNKKCSEIIDALKAMKELHLEEEQKYTEFIMISKTNFVPENLIIDETFLPFQQVFVYELLNFEGIKKVFGNDDIENNKVLPLNKQNIKNMIELTEEEEEDSNNDIFTIFSEKRNSTSQNLSLFQQEKMIKKITVNDNESNIKSEDKEFRNKEILVQIFHRYKTNYTTTTNNYQNEYDPLFNYQNYSYLKSYRDFIILANKNCIKAINLYEMLWEKYSYFLDTPAKYEPSLWWKQYMTNSSRENTTEINNNNNAKIPFTIKIIKKSTKGCVFCPWFRFCTGCVLSPKDNNYLNLCNDCLILIEWNKSIVNKEIKENNPLMILNHSTSFQLFETTDNDEEKKSIYNCLDLFTREETMKNIFCEKCNKKTNFKKKLEIDRLPKYLVLVLKRFKYTSMYTTKIENLITFPLLNLDLRDYVVSSRICGKYDLFGVVNHCGGLTGGHYHCNIKQDSIWIKYDDSNTCETDKKIETSNAYLLIYKYNIKKDEIIGKKEQNLNFMGLMDTAYKIYLKQFNFRHLFNYVLNDKDQILEEYTNNCEFYYGEPVNIDGKNGFLVNISGNNSDKVSVKIKLNKGYFESRILKKKIIKETLKCIEENNVKVTVETHPVKEISKGNSICGGCLLF